jgi:hypothetical protein
MSKESWFLPMIARVVFAKNFAKGDHRLIPFRSKFGASANL